MNDDQGKVMNTLLRMIVPIRREFGVSLDVNHFLHDLDYRGEIIAKALASQDTRLRDYAKYVQQLIGSPRTASEPPAPPRRVGAEEARTSIIESALPAAGAQGPSTAAETRNREDELREQIMRKYTAGLR